MMTMSNKCDDDEDGRKGGEDGHDGGEDGHDGGGRVHQLLPQGGAAGEDPGVLDHQVHLHLLLQMLKSFMIIMMMMMRQALPGTLCASHDFASFKSTPCTCGHKTHECQHPF